MYVSHPGRLCQGVAHISVGMKIGLQRFANDCKRFQPGTYHRSIWKCIVSKSRKQSLMRPKSRCGQVQQPLVVYSSRDSFRWRPSRSCPHSSYSSGIKVQANSHLTKQQQKEMEKINGSNIKHLRVPHLNGPPYMSLYLAWGSLSIILFVLHPFSQFQEPSVLLFGFEGPIINQANIWNLCKNHVCAKFISWAAWLVGGPYSYPKTSFAEFLLMYFQFLIQLSHYIFK